MGDGATQGPAQVVAAACDGACSGNPGPGGWGALLRFSDGSVHELGGAEGATTNNRMELTAALALLRELRELPRHPGLVIRTDSRYLIDGLQKWLPGWKRKGWRTASGGAVLNRDLWEQLDGSRIRGLELQHVRGHSGDPDNDRCDAIAVAFSRGQSPQLEAGERLASAGLEARLFAHHLGPRALELVVVGARQQALDVSPQRLVGHALGPAAALQDEAFEGLRREPHAHRLVEVEAVVSLAVEGERGFRVLGNRVSRHAPDVHEGAAAQEGGGAAEKSRIP